MSCPKLDLPLETGVVSSCAIADPDASPLCGRCRISALLLDTPQIVKPNTRTPFAIGKDNFSTFSSSAILFVEFVDPVCFIYDL